MSRTLWTDTGAGPWPSRSATAGSRRRAAIVVVVALIIALVGLGRPRSTVMAATSPHLLRATEPIAAQQSPVPAGYKSLGGLNLDAYCQSIGYDRSYVNPITGPNAAYGWVCTSSSGGSQAINIDSACAFQYPGQGSKAFIQDPNNAYTWICIVPSQDILAFGTQPPSEWPMTKAFTTAVRVVVEDQNGHIDTFSVHSITVALGAASSGGGGALSGTLTQTTVNGVATFPGLAIDKAGQGYTLTASDPQATSATSDPFNVDDTWGWMQHLNLPALIGSAPSGGSCATWNEDILRKLNSLRASSPDVFTYLDYGPVSSVTPGTTEGHHSGVVMYISGTDWHTTGVVVHGTAFFSQYGIATSVIPGQPNPLNLQSTSDTWTSGQFMFTEAPDWEDGSSKQVIPTPALSSDARGNPLYFGTAYPQPGSTMSPPPGACPFPPQGVSTHSPVDLTLINSAGQHIQTRGGSIVVNELPASIYWPAYAALDHANQTVDWSLVLPQDTYQITLTGTGSGPFTLTGHTLKPDGTVLTVNQTGTITPGVQRKYVLKPGGSLTLADTTPPTCTVSASPASVWPPNHKPVAVTATVSVHDDGSGPGPLALLSRIASGGSADISGFDKIGTPALSADGKTETFTITGSVTANKDEQYTINYRAEDLAGNATTCPPVTISVPHDQGQHP